MSVAGWLARVRSKQEDLGDPFHKSVQKRLRDVFATLASERDVLETTSRQIAEAQDLSVVRMAGCLEELRLEEVRNTVKALNSSLRRQLRYSKALQEQHRASRKLPDSSKLLNQLGRIAAARLPILVGPWTGDVGLELMYWVPFVRWFAHHFHVPANRLHVVSRGGAPWYRDIAAEYSDLLSLYSAPEFRARLRHGSQSSDEEFGRQIGDHVFPDGADSYVLLHPGVMYELFGRYWRHEAPLQQVVRFTTPKPLPRPTMALPDLPERFVAVRFAFSPSFPDIRHNRARLDLLLASLTQTTDVVWLGAGIDGVDGADQSEYVPPPGCRMHHIDDLLTPQQGLAVQAAVIARADAYIGTYGGLSYVAPFYAVRSVAFYSTRNFFPHYRRMADHILDARKNRSVIVLDVSDEVLLRSVLDVAGGSSCATRERVDASDVAST